MSFVFFPFCRSFFVEFVALEWDKRPQTCVKTAVLFFMLICTSVIWKQNHLEKQNCWLITFVNTTKDFGIYYVLLQQQVNNTFPGTDIEIKQMSHKFFFRRNNFLRPLRTNISWFVVTIEFSLSRFDNMIRTMAKFLTRLATHIRQTIFNNSFFFDALA